MNRATTLVLCSALILPVGAVAMATGSPSVLAAEDKTAEGTIKSVDTANNKFVLTVGVGNDKKEVTVTINATTKYTLDGKDSTKDAALVVGNTAKATLTDNVATTVAARAAKKP